MSCGINQRTVESWISILEASYIIYLLQPYHENFNKRVIKTPKIYFYDTGLACSLLGINSADELAFSSMKGHMFEALIISDFYKQFYNLGSNPSLYFWRDKNGYIEIDCIIDRGLKLIPVEIKSGATERSEFFDSLNKWNELAKTDASNGYVVYNGDQVQIRKGGNLVGWQSAGSLAAKLIK